MPDIMPMERIASKIYVIRDTRVMLDRDLSELYGVKTKVLKQAVRRNITCFPEDFMFELTEDENRALRSQRVTLKGKKRDRWGHPLKGESRKNTSPCKKSPLLLGSNPGTAMRLIRAKRGLRRLNHGANVTEPQVIGYLSLRTPDIKASKKSKSLVMFFCRR